MVDQATKQVTCPCCGFARPCVATIISCDSTYSGNACLECVRLAHKLGHRVITWRSCHVCGGPLYRGDCPACNPIPRWMEGGRNG